MAEYYGNDATPGQEAKLRSMEAGLIKQIDGVRKTHERVTLSANSKLRGLKEKLGQVQNEMNRLGIPARAMNVTMLSGLVAFEESPAQYQARVSSSGKDRHIPYRP